MTVKLVFGGAGAEEFPASVFELAVIQGLNGRQIYILKAFSKFTYDSHFD